MSETAPDVLALFAPALKHQLKARVAMDGPTGSGKTWTALQWARILAGPDGTVAVIDTEERSAEYYAPTPNVTPVRVNWWDPPYDFSHMPWKPPYDPIRLTQVVKAAAPHFDVLIVDSLTHFWTGEGGTLDVVDKAAERSGNSFAGWKVGTPVQNDLIQALTRASCHVLVTMRSKMEYVIEDVESRGRDGKSRIVKVPRKIGLQPEQRANVEYEFTVVADLDLDHKLTISKSRCDLVADAVAPKGRSADLANTFKGWLDSGETRPTPDQVESLKAILNGIAPPAGGLIRAAFRERGWRLDRLNLAEYETAAAWVGDQIREAAGSPVEAVGQNPSPEPAPPVSEPPSPVSEDSKVAALGGFDDDPEYPDRIAQYVAMLPKPTIVEMAKKRGYPDEAIDVTRARITVALVEEHHPAPSAEVLARLGAK